MNLKEHFAHIIEKLHKQADNVEHPFVSTEFNSNPFKDAFSQTYVWVEVDEENTEG
ncbi:hypothetical protein tpqmel_1072 [Candidatus Gastranaerophilus sp. (ex Termes propinquus)]|nr:hypothetical protein tpqmel_1072 [Candidatus Gastranaerophilus sp. (ex Termes propinquus)]